jgi:hypothetical protein
MRPYPVPEQTSLQGAAIGRTMTPASCIFYQQLTISSSFADFLPSAMVSSVRWS